MTAEETKRLICVVPRQSWRDQPPSRSAGTRWSVGLPAGYALGLGSLIEVWCRSVLLSQPSRTDEIASPSVAHVRNWQQGHCSADSP
jgi:hypothetical protein